MSPEALDIYYCLDMMANLYLCLCLFFFFKQKTAYEVRISDWSSDVCSSDLGRLRVMQAAPDQLERGVDGLMRAKPGVALDAASGNVLMSGEIGRASCRERVCQ